MKSDFKKARNDFPMLKKTMHGKPLIYFDSAATAQKPQSVIDAITTFYHDRYGTVHRAVYELVAESTKSYESSRSKIKSFINAAKDEEIIFTRGTTDAINLVADSFGKAFLKKGDEVLISEMEHHSNIVPWQMVCEERGAQLKIIPMDDRGVLRMDEYEKMLNPKVKIVAICHVANSTGTVNPIKKIIKRAHAVGAKVLVDGAQGAPHMPIDVQDLDVDFYAFSGHKLYGPTGIGILYGKESLLEKLPPHHGGGDMISSCTFEKTTYNKLPLKFEAGTPMIAEVIGLGAAVDYINDLGIASIHAYEQELLNYATKLMEKIKGVRILGTSPEKGAIICFTVDGLHPLDVGTFLDMRGIAIRTGHHCAQPSMKHFQVPASCRASFAFYNTKEEIDAFVQALQEIIKNLQK